MRLSSGQEAQHRGTRTTGHCSTSRCSTTDGQATAGELRLGGGAQHVRVRPPPRPQRLLQDGLVDEHAQPVDRPAPAAAAALQPRRAERVVDEVGDHLLGPQQAGISGQLGRPHADRCRVDHDVGAPRCRRACRRVQSLDERDGVDSASLGPVDDADARRRRRDPRASMTLRAAAPAPSMHTRVAHPPSRRPQPRLRRSRLRRSNGRPGSRSFRRRRC